METELMVTAVIQTVRLNQGPNARSELTSMIYVLSQSVEMGNLRNQMKWSLLI